jgi:hypothetical protein
LCLDSIKKWWEGVKIIYMRDFVTYESHRLVSVPESFRPKGRPRFSPRKHKHIPIAVRAENVVEKMILGRQEFLQAPKFSPVNSHNLITPYKSITSNTHYIKFRQDSSVGIATRYGLGGVGIESQWRRDFPHLSRPALGPSQPPIQWVPALSRG